MVPRGQEPAHHDIDATLARLPTQPRAHGAEDVVTAIVHGRPPPVRLRGFHHGAAWGQHSPLRLQPGHMRDVAL
jgi:hypothetical protein